MGIFDFFARDAASRAARLKPKLTQRYGDPGARQKAIRALAALATVEAIAVLLLRFTFAVEPQTTDADEKAQAFEGITAHRELAVAPTKEFLVKNDNASSWMLRILEAILPDGEVVSIALGELNRLGSGYSRDSEKKEVLIHYLGEKRDERIGPCVLQLLNDMSDDVKAAALRTLAKVNYADAWPSVVELLTHVDTAKRVKAECAQALADASVPLGDKRALVEPHLPANFSTDRAGVVRRKIAASKG